MAAILDSDITSILADVENEIFGLAKSALSKAEGSSAGDGGSAAGGPPEGSDGGGSASASPVDAGDGSQPPAPPVASAAASPDPAAAAPASAAPAAPGADPSAAPPAGGDPSAAAADPAAAAAGDHQALVAEFAKMPPEHVAQILEAAKEVLLTAQPPGGAPPAGGPAPSPADPSAPPDGLAGAQGAQPPQGLAQSEVGDGGLKGGKPAGAASPAPGNAQASFPKTDNSGANPLHPAAESGNMHAKLASPSNLVPTSTLKSDPGPMNPGAETGKTSVPNSSMLGTTANVPETPLTGAARKSEQELLDLRKANADLNTRLERLTQVVTEAFERPIRKAVTGLDYVNVRGTAAGAAPVRLDPKQITERLMEKVKDQSLTKSDRQLINDFYDRRIDVSKIEHLLK